MSENMENFIIFVVVESATAFVTGIGCRLASRRHRQPGWRVALLAAVSVAGLAVYLDNGNILLHPSQWPHNKRSLAGILDEFAFAIGIGVVPALIVVRHYRERFKNNPKPVL